MTMFFRSRPVPTGARFWIASSSSLAPSLTDRRSAFFEMNCFSSLKAATISRSPWSCRLSPSLIGCGEDVLQLGLHLLVRLPLFLVLALDDEELAPFGQLSAVEAAKQLPDRHAQLAR